MDRLGWHDKCTPVVGAGASNRTPADSVTIMVDGSKSAEEAQCAGKEAGENPGNPYQVCVPTCSACTARPAAPAGGEATHIVYEVKAVELVDLTTVSS